MNDPDKAIRIAFALGKEGTEPFKDMGPAELWESIKSEQRHAAEWLAAHEYLSWMISDRVKDLEIMLTGKLAAQETLSRDRVERLVQAYELDGGTWDTERFMAETQRVLDDELAADPSG